MASRLPGMVHPYKLKEDMSPMCSYDNVGSPVDLFREFIQENTFDKL